MQVKLLMQWDVRQGMEPTYSEFIVNEFIPRAQRLGLDDFKFWYTSYGECEQILASAIAENGGKMRLITKSEEWVNLRSRLDELVVNFEQKVVAAKSSFQL